MPCEGRSAVANRVYWGLLQLGGICAWQGSGRRPGGCLYHLNDACRACRPVILVTTLFPPVLIATFPSLESRDKLAAPTWCARGGYGCAGMATGAGNYVDVCTRRNSAEKPQVLAPAIHHMGACSSTAWHHAKHTIKPRRLGRSALPRRDMAAGRRRERAELCWYRLVRP